MTISTRPASTAGHSPKFAIVALLALAAIAILIATDAVNPYPNLKAAYLICAVIGSIGFIQLAYAIVSAKYA